MSSIPMTSEMQQTNPDRGDGCVFLSWLRSPLGPLVAGATAKGVCLLEFTDRRMLEAESAAVRNMFDRIAILIPSHRLVNKNGQLAGNGGGLWRKQFLLDLERSNR